jgi:hypothetical protein
LQLCFEFELDSGSKVVYYLLFYRRAKSRKTISNIWVVFLIYNLVQFGKFKINCYRVGVTTVCPLSQTGSRRFQMPTAAHTSATQSRGLWCAPPVTDSGSTPASVTDLRDPPRPSLSPPPIRTTGRWGYFPLSLFLPPRRSAHRHPLVAG